MAKALEKASLPMGEQLYHRGEIKNHEAVSTTLFSSGVELAPRRKDHELMRAFVRNARLNYTSGSDAGRALTPDPETERS